METRQWVGQDPGFLTLRRQANDSSRFGDSRYDTERFLPATRDAQTLRWDIYGEDRHPQLRRHFRIVCNHRPRSLLQAENAYELFQTLAQAHIGWLNQYMSGYLHGNISISNIMSYVPAPNVVPKFAEPADTNSFAKELEELRALADKLKLDEGYPRLDKEQSETREPLDKADGDLTPETLESSNNPCHSSLRLGHVSDSEKQL